MKAKFKYVTALFCGLFTAVRLYSQGYLLPNGVVYGGYSTSLGSEIDVLHDPVNSYYTGFFLKPVNINAFSFSVIVDVSVRVFLVPPNDPISLQPILSMNYTELGYQPNYVFNVGVPFYVGLYTGNDQFAPPNGIYNDPIFGWAELENVNGTIQLLNSALEYQGGGILAGTQTILPVPEPETWALLLCGAVLFGVGRWMRSNFRIQH